MTDINIWVEKFRPTSFSNYIGNKYMIEKLNEYIKNQEIPHILFSGIQGTGKTTAGRILVNSIDSDTLYINASDENNIDTVRNKIKDFIMTVSFNKWKIVFLDEADFLTINAQSALRNLIETYSKSARFILTCNYVDKIIPALRSRMQTFIIEPPSMVDVAPYMTNILDTEGVKYNDKDVITIIKSYYPDVRKIINMCQSNVIDNTLSIEVNNIMVADFIKDVITQLNLSNRIQSFQNIRQIIVDNKVNDYQKLFDYMYEHINDITDDMLKQGLIIIVLGDAQYKESTVVNKEINYMSAIVQILEILHS